ncbi:hypothetical protein RESH_05623 [Rhodopirellula europaea SH398]|uniref:Transposase n=1 Tax=Rhodopirellula europaea SH398 TaxID=1263868 RepID=M5S805_9BACT|nr:hypothetical protein RESH_05623 [Rhodopirellula europaea SH398]
MRGHRGISKKADDYSPAFADLASTTIPTWAGLCRIVSAVLLGIESSRQLHSGFARL